MLDVLQVFIALIKKARFTIDTERRHSVERMAAIKPQPPDIVRFSWFWNMANFVGAMSGIGEPSMHVYFDLVKVDFVVGMPRWDRHIPAPVPPRWRSA